MKLDIKLIKVNMASQNLSQKCLAKKANVQEATLSRILNNKSYGNTVTWGKIAKALDVDVKELIED